MDQLQQARQLNESGLFRQALSVLETQGSEARDSRPTVQVLKAELLARVGRRRESQELIRNLLTTKALSLSDRSLCDFVIAQIALERGDTDTAISHLNKAITSAKRADDLERACVAQLKLLLVLSDGPGREATGPLLAEVRANTAKTGKASLLASVHVHFAQIEAYRSSIITARRHIRLAQQLLLDAPNAWLESMISNIELGLSLMSSEFDLAQIHAQRGQELAQRSGGAQEFAVNQGNAGYAFQALGEFDAAVACYERALEQLVAGSEPYNAVVDSLVRVRLAQNQLGECEQLLADCNFAGKREPSPTFVSRHMLITRAQVWAQKGMYDASEQSLYDALRMSREAKDPLLVAVALVEIGNLQVRRGDFTKALATIQEVAGCISDKPVYVYGRYQELLGIATASRSELANGNLSRAGRVYQGLHHREALKALRQRSQSANEIASSPISWAVQSAAALFSCTKSTEVVALELFQLLVATASFEAAEILLRLDDGTEQVLIRHDALSLAPHRNDRSHRLHVGRARGGALELVLRLKDDVESVSTFHAASFMLSAATMLAKSKDDQAERTTLWPSDEFMPTGANQVISGHMRELMTFAQRVARTTVNVLITGESGTGKEILARAIHDFSDRAHKPFVPFNCAAIPRDLVESQLFGHRRGAFTGADRDQLGLIRSAADGTVFLDEVGEMSIDLQPKLLRFLESGEIAPLGEPSPFNVSVRVIAATNANLEDAVRDGKFREDLFYRLNVVRLAIKPLRERRDEIPAMVQHFVAAAAREFKKGQLQVSEDTMERLLLFRWPGNVRQLQNEIRRMVALAEPNSTLEPAAISPDILRAMPDLRQPLPGSRQIAVALDDKLQPTLSRVEYEMIKAALRTHHGKVHPAAKALGISRKGLYLKRQRLGL